MSVFREYRKLKIKYLDSEKRLDEAVSQKEQLFMMTQPNAVSFEGERVDGGEQKNLFDEYLIKKENLDKRIDEIKDILEQRRLILEIKEKELRESEDLYDKVYRMHFIDMLSAYRISRKIHYSKAQIYRIIAKMQKDETK